MTLGIPYAPAGVDAHGYYVECPECGHRSRGCDESARTAEDALTKGAAANHAVHWTAEHEEHDAEPAL